MLLGRIRPNGLYGFRTRKTLQDEEIWYKANRFAGGALVACGLWAPVGVWILEAPLALVPTLLVGGPLLLAVVFSFVYLSRL